jgi:Flp pilus assembly CpaE family ATPase
VLNRASTLAGLSSDDIAAMLGTRSILQIPTGGPELTQAINEGRPLALHQLKSPIGRALQSVAEHVRTRIDDRAVRR